MSTTEERTFGGQTQVAPCGACSFERRAGRPRPVARVRLARRTGAHARGEQHEGLCGILADAGAEVLFASSDVAGDPDAVYVCDPAIMSDRGAMVLRPGKVGRRVEPAAIAAELGALGVPVAFEMGEPATAEGGDTMWLDEGRCSSAGAIGRTRRASGRSAPRCPESTCSPSTSRIARTLACLHLLSLLSPLAAIWSSRLSR